MRVHFFIILVLLVISVELRAQSFQKNIRFASYLLDKRYFDEAIYSLKEIPSYQLSKIQSDSLHFLLGSAYYQMKQLDSSILKFDLVGETIPSLKTESIFFSALNEAYLKRYHKSEKKLKSIYLNDSSLISLCQLELRGVSLLQRNWNAYDSINQISSKYNLLYSKQLERMDVFRKKLGQNLKSPIKAGFLSAIIPGAGKFYAGYNAQGIFNFIISGILAAQMIEAYEKAGMDSFRFAAYGTLFGGFYIATIWGSSLAVKIKQREINNSIDDQILFDMHIPIRTAFK